MEKIKNMFYKLVNFIKQKFNTKVSFITAIIAIVAILFAGYFYTQAQKFKNNPQEVAQKEKTELIEKVSKLIVLPTGEEPTIATVSDPQALKDQVFFNLAQKGDKVLIYSVAKKAILYSVTLNKIIDIAPLNSK